MNTRNTLAAQGRELPASVLSAEQLRTLSECKGWIHKSTQLAISQELDHFEKRVARPLQEVNRIKSESHAKIQALLSEQNARMKDLQRVAGLGVEHCCENKTLEHWVRENIRLPELATHYDTYLKSKQIENWRSEDVVNRAHRLCANQQVYQGIELYRQAIQTQRHLELMPDLAQTLYFLGLALDHVGSFEEAIQAYRESCSMFQNLNMTDNLQQSLYSLCNAYWALSQFSQAIEVCTELTSLQESVNNKEGLAGTLHFLGLICCKTGQRGSAVECLQKSIHLKKELRLRQELAQSLHMIGDLHRKMQQHSQALEAIQETCNIYRHLCLKKELASALNSLGKAFHAAENYSEASKAYEEMRKIAQELNSPQQVSTALHGLARGHTKCQQWAAADNAFQESLRILRPLNLKQKLASILRDWGHGLLENSQFPEAITALDESLEIWQELGMTSGLGSCQRGIGSAFFYMELYNEAIPMLITSIASLHSDDDFEQLAIAYLHLGIAYSSDGCLDGAVESLRISSEMFLSQGQYRESAETLRTLAKLLSTPDPLQADRLYLEAIACTRTCSDSRLLHAYLYEAGTLMIQTKGGQKTVGDSTSHPRSRRVSSPENYDNAAAMFQESAEIRHTLGLKKDEAHSRYWQGVCLVKANRWDNAMVALTSSKEIFETLELRSELIQSLQCIGKLLFIRKDFCGAVQVYQQAEQLVDEQMHVKNLLKILKNLGFACLAAKMTTEAIHYFSRWADTAPGLIDKVKLTKTLDKFSKKLAKAGEKLVAIDFYRRSLSYKRCEGRSKDVAHALCILGTVLCSIEDYREATNLLTESLEISESEHLHSPRVNALYQLGEVKYKTELYQEAITLYDQCIQLATKKTDNPTKGEAYLSKARIHWLLNQKDQAESAEKEFNNLAKHAKKKKKCLIF